MAFLFACAALMLITIAARLGWAAFSGRLDDAAAQSIIEVLGLLAAAVVALQIAETIFEEEVVRDADISAPTRVRRFLSRFFVVVVVALSIEGLVATFKGAARKPDATSVCGEHRRRSGRAPRRVGRVRSPQSLGRGTRTRTDGEAKREDEKLD